jgi:hypothetical protein
MEFGQVFDFVGGKLEWLAHALPVEGTGPHHAVAGDVVGGHVATCRPDASREEVLAILDRVSAPSCVIVNEHWVVLGRVRRSRLADASTPGDVVEPGPATVQLTEPLGPLTERMRRANVASILVTDPKGVLLGMMRRSAATTFLESHECCEPGRHPRR